jgi:hypothetical protein
MRYTATCTRFMLGGTWQAGGFIPLSCVCVSLMMFLTKSNFVGYSAAFWRDVAVAKRKKKRKGKQIVSKWRVSYVNENGTRMPCLGPLGYTKLKYARGIVGVKVACAT